MTPTTTAAALVAAVAALCLVYPSTAGVADATQDATDAPEEDDEEDEACPETVGRAAWGAASPRLVERLTGPAPFVIVHHTYSPGACATADACARSMRSMQSYHMGKGWNDIGYNFVIGGDGRVYQGRGWGVVGAHAPRYNNRSVGVAFIGDYTAVAPPEELQALARRLVACGVARGSVRSNYTLLGHRQVRQTECPGDAFFARLRTWPHWAPVVDGGLPLPPTSAP